MNRHETAHKLADLELLVIAVNYGSDDATLCLVNSIVPAIEDARSSVIVVDNTRRDDERAYMGRLNGLHPAVVGLASPQNLGYLGGARYGVDRFLSAGGRFDCLMVSNVDLTLQSLDMMDTIRELLQDETIGVIAPSIVSSRTGRDLNPFLTGRPKASTMRRYTVLFRYPLVANLYRTVARPWRNLYRAVRGTRRTAAQEAHSRTSEDSIYAPHGSCMIFTHRYFERGGDLQFPMFLFQEEIYVAEKARKAGVRVVYEPRIRFVHDEHVSTGLWRSRTLCRFAYESARYTSDTFF